MTKGEAKMNQLNDALNSNRLAVEAVIAAAETSGPAWAVARAPGKWSPAEILEHLARSMEESANEVAGMPSKFPTLPSLVRPLVRAVFFNRTLRKQAFPKARTNKSMDPAFGPETPAAGRLVSKKPITNSNAHARLRSVAVHFSRVSFSARYPSSTMFDFRICTRGITCVR